MKYKCIFKNDSVFFIAEFLNGYIPFPNQYIPLIINKDIAPIMFKYKGKFLGYDFYESFKYNFTEYETLFNIEKDFQMVKSFCIPKILE